MPNEKRARIQPLHLRALTISRRSRPAISPLLSSSRGSTYAIACSNVFEASKQRVRRKNIVAQAALRPPPDPSLLRRGHSASPPSTRARGSCVASRRRRQKSSYQSFPLRRTRCRFHRIGSTSGPAFSAAPYVECLFRSPCVHAPRRSRACTSRDRGRGQLSVSDRRRVLVRPASSST